MRWLRSPYLWLGLILVAVAVAIRVHNAYAYGLNLGYDASFNWDYILKLRKSWALPAPDADWSTAHPPLYYYASAGIGRLLGQPYAVTQIAWTRMFGSGFGILAAVVAVALVLRADPGNLRRAFLAGLLLLFLPVQLYMSAMLNEELVAAGFISLALFGLVWELSRDAPPSHPLLSAAGIGLAGGLALLTKLSGALVICVSVATFAAVAWRRGALGAGCARIAVAGALALASGGWYFAHNWFVYGYLYPFALEAHEVMFTMPPGSRSVLDYVYIPFSTLTHPDLLSSGLLHSVWGSTYLNVWFDGYRHFFAKEDIAVTRAASGLLVLGLLPTGAFLSGLWRGAARALRNLVGPDLPQLLLVAATLLGYVLFTWRNPWFATVKASYLLGLSVPFAFYASESLDRWLHGGRARRIAIWLWLALLVITVAATFTIGPVFEKPYELPGIDWTPVEP